MKRILLKRGDLLSLHEASEYVSIPKGRIEKVYRGGYLKGYCWRHHSYNKRGEQVVDSWEVEYTEGVDTERIYFKRTDLEMYWEVHEGKEGR